MKSALIRSFPGPYFPAFGLNTDRCSGSFRIQSQFDKIQTRKTPNTYTFHSVLIITLNSPMWILVIISSIRSLLIYSRLPVALSIFTNSLFYLVLIHLFLTVSSFCFLQNPIYFTNLLDCKQKTSGCLLPESRLNLFFVPYIRFLLFCLLVAVLIFINIDQLEQCR